MAYRFKVRFRIPAFAVPQINESPISLFESEGRAEIRLLCSEAVSPEDTDQNVQAGESDERLITAALLGESYETQDLASQEGERVKAALLLWALNNGFGVGFLAGTPTRVEIERTTEYFLHVTLAVRLPIDRTVEGFTEGIRAGFNLGTLSPKVLLAMELFVAAYFDSSLNSQLVMRVMAIEALMEQAEVSGRVTSCIAALNDVVRAQGLEPKERDDLLRSLCWLSLETKTRTGIKLAERLLEGRKYGRSKPGKVFRRLYEARSRIVHDGTSGLEQEELRRLNDLCGVFVKDLLDASISVSNP
jgi:hypothetical protein